MTLLRDSDILTLLEIMTLFGSGSIPMLLSDSHLKDATDF